MLVKELMHTNLITIKPDTTLKAANNLMRENDVRHLPVVSENELVGIVTDRDLRLATSKLAKSPFEVDSKVEQIMSTPVETTRPNEPIEVAVQIMRELKIGCMPVLDAGKLVGIVTGVDLLDAMLILTGTHTPSGRLDVRLKDRKGEIARLTKLISDKNISIHSILSYQEKNHQLRVVLRVSTMEIRSLAETICSAGFEVVWPIQISCVE